MRKNNTSWHLMSADNAPLIISFFDRVFRENNTRQISENELIMQLEDYLFELRDRSGEDLFPRSASEYLDEWAGLKREWLRKYYPPNSDLAHFDLTPGTERVLQWVDSLIGMGFLGTESRLKTSFDLLRQIVHGVEEDKELRLKELEEQKREINKQIQDVKEGNIPLLDDRQVRERFLQFRRTARELLSDFRAVEHNFRELDIDIRRQIASWDGEKGEFLEQFFGSHDKISGSDEGKSFNAFWDFIMSPSSQDEISELLDKVYELEALGDLLEDRKLKTIHFDWMTAGEQTQHTAARLSAQLRRFLDDRAFWENRRITEILGSIEKKASLLQGNIPGGDFAEIEGLRPDLIFPMAYPLYTPTEPVELVSLINMGEDSDIDTSRLYDLVYIDEERLTNNILLGLEEKSQIRLVELIESYPLKEGLAELICYVNLAEKDPLALVLEGKEELVSWINKKGILRKAKLPKIIFNREVSHGK